MALFSKLNSALTLLVLFATILVLLYPAPVDSAIVTKTKSSREMPPREIHDKKFRPVFKRKPERDTMAVDSTEGFYDISNNIPPPANPPKALPFPSVPVVPVLSVVSSHTSGHNKSSHKN
jgi:hypothetical protein